jgi:hypothetical protein
MSSRIDYGIVQLLVQLAHEKRPVADMIRAVQPGRHPVEVTYHFRAAFGLNLLETKPIVLWLRHGLADSWIHDAMWPEIDAHRSFWSSS